MRLPISQTSRRSRLRLLLTRRESGQVFAIVAIALVGIAGVAGFVVDVGSWYRTHRSQQAIADASALAAAADLPTSTSQATTDAQAFAVKNGGSSGGLTISYSTTYTANDTVTVQAATTAPGFFLKALGINSTNVKASATALSMALTTAFGAGPFAIYYTQPELSGPGCPCWNVSTTLQFNKVGPGGFEIVNIDGSTSPSGQQTLGDWIVSGCNCSTSTPVWLTGDPGAKFNGSEVAAGLAAMVGKILLFPVYDSTRANGSNMQYHIIAFVGFKLTGYTFNGSNGTMTGSFQKVTWRGTGGSTSPGAYSATTVQLTG